MAHWVVVIVESSEITCFAGCSLYLIVDAGTFHNHSSVLDAHDCWLLELHIVYVDTDS